ncbi:MAG: hypothetical protein WC760_08870 [Bacteroidia bacterium]|jgi:hypothetical protein
MKIRTLFNFGLSLLFLHTNGQSVQSDKEFESSFREGMINSKEFQMINPELKMPICDCFIKKSKVLFPKFVDWIHDSLKPYAPTIYSTCFRELKSNSSLKSLWNERYQDSLKVFFFISDDLQVLSEDARNILIEYIIEDIKNLFPLGLQIYDQNEKLVFFEAINRNSITKLRKRYKSN